MEIEVIVAVILGIFVFHLCTCWFTGNLYYWFVDGDNDADELDCLTWPIDFVIEICERIYYKIHEKR